MQYITYEQFKNLDEYKDFIKENPSIGTLKIQAFTAYGAIPVPNTKIIISKDIEEYRIVFFQGDTDSSGIIDNIELPAPPGLSTTSTETPQYTIYDMNAIHEGYETIKKYSIGMFGDVKVIQYVKMTPDVTLEGVDKNGN